MNAHRPHTAASVRDEVTAILSRLGVDVGSDGGNALSARSPITGEVVAEVATVTVAEVGPAIERAHEAYLNWRTVPAPRRGELVRLLGEELRAAAPPAPRAR